MMMLADHLERRMQCSRTATAKHADGHSRFFSREDIACASWLLKWQLHNHKALAKPEPTPKKMFIQIWLHPNKLQVSATWYKWVQFGGQATNNLKLPGVQFSFGHGLIIQLPSCLQVVMHVACRKLFGCEPVGCFLEPADGGKISDGYFEQTWAGHCTIVLWNNGQSLFCGTMAQ